MDARDVSRRRLQALAQAFTLNQPLSLSHYLWLMYTHTHTHTAGCVQVVLLSLCLVSSLQRLFNCDSDKQSSSVQVWPPPPPERSEGGVSGRGQGGGQQERSSLTQIKDYFSPTTTT